MTDKQTVDWAIAEHIVRLTQLGATEVELNAIYRLRNRLQEMDMLKLEQGAVRVRFPECEAECPVKCADPVCEASRPAKDETFGKCGGTSAPLSAAECGGGDTLGLTQEYMRLECFKATVPMIANYDGRIEAAKKLYAWVTSRGN